MIMTMSYAGLCPGGGVGELCGACLALLSAPWIVGACQRCHWRRADAVAVGR